MEVINRLSRGTPVSRIAWPSSSSSGCGLSKSANTNRAAGNVHCRTWMLTTESTRVQRPSRVTFLTARLIIITLHAACFTFYFRDKSASGIGKRSCIGGAMSQVENALALKRLVETAKT